jgi:hypothetical protein
MIELSRFNFLVQPCPFACLPTLRKVPTAPWRKRREMGEGVGRKRRGEGGVRENDDIFGHSVSVTTMMIILSTFTVLSLLQMGAVSTTVENNTMNVLSRKAAI